jgi:hypothetical protein
MQEVMKPVAGLSASSVRRGKLLRVLMFFVGGADGGAQRTLKTINPRYCDDEEVR